ncbi:MAG: hypothetical protein AAF191_07175, partial [Verrucomicrobiota bacterium]
INDGNGGPTMNAILQTDGYDSDWVLSADYRFRLPFDPSAQLTASLLTGENGFGKHTLAYGVGLQKVWNGHDHGGGGEDFCTGAFMVTSEFLGRSVDALLEEEHHEEEGEDHGDEEGEEEEIVALDFSDFGFSTSFLYGLSDSVILGLRHDWVSQVDEAELADTHRISPAITAFLGPQQRIQTRFQYDYLQTDGVETEHAGWFQVQFQWGGEGGPHHGHNH